MNAFLNWFVTRSHVTAGIVVGVTAALILRGSDWRRFLPWCKDHTQFLTGTGVGIVFGAFVILLFGSDPGDAIAGLIGAFAGIVAAIGGGLWLWQVQDEKSVQRTLAAIDSACGILIPNLDSLRYYIAKKETAMIVATAEAVPGDITRFNYAVARYQSHLIETDPSIQDEHSKLEQQLSFIQQDVESLTAIANKAFATPGSIDQVPETPAVLQSECANIHARLWNTRRSLAVLAPKSLGSWPRSLSDERAQIEQHKREEQRRIAELEEEYAAGLHDDDDDGSIS